MKSLNGKIVLFDVYKINEIKIGDLVQLEFLGDIKTLKSKSLHYKILRIDPKGSGKVIGTGLYEQRGREDLFHISDIKRNYRMHTIIVGKGDHKAKKNLSFDRLEYERKHGMIK